MRALIRLYPAWWRRRYGDEYAALLAELPARPGLVIDVVRAAVDAHLSPPQPVSGGHMLDSQHGHRPPRGDRIAAIVALLALATPVSFLVLQLLPRSGPTPSSSPTGPLLGLDGFFQHPVGVALILLGPVAAFLAGAWATIGLRMQTDGSERVAVVAIRVRGMHLALMALSVALIGAFAVYLVAENL